MLERMFNEGIIDEKMFDLLYNYLFYSSSYCGFMDDEINHPGFKRSYYGTALNTFGKMLIDMINEEWQTK